MLGTLEFFKFEKSVEQTDIVKVELRLRGTLTYEAVGDKVVRSSELSVKEVSSKLAQSHHHLEILFRNFDVFLGD